MSYSLPQLQIPQDYGSYGGGGGYSYGDPSSLYSAAPSTPLSGGGYGNSFGATQGYSSLRTSGGFGDLNYGSFSYGGGRGYGAGVGTTGYESRSNILDRYSQSLPSASYAGGIGGNYSTQQYAQPQQQQGYGGLYGGQSVNNNFSAYAGVGGSFGSWLGGGVTSQPTSARGGYAQQQMTQPGYGGGFGGYGGGMGGYGQQMTQMSSLMSQGQMGAPQIPQQQQMPQMSNQMGGQQQMGPVGQFYARQGMDPSNTPTTITNPGYLFGANQRSMGMGAGGYGMGGQMGGQQQMDPAQTAPTITNQAYMFGQQGPPEGGPQGGPGGPGGPGGAGGPGGFPFPPFGFNGPPGSPGHPFGPGPFPFFMPPPELLGMMGFSSSRDSLPITTQYDGEGKLVQGYWEAFDDQTQCWSRLAGNVGATLDHHLSTGLKTASCKLNAASPPYEFDLTQMVAKSGSTTKNIRRVPTAPTVGIAGEMAPPPPPAVGGDSFYPGGAEAFGLSRPPPAQRAAPSRPTPGVSSAPPPPGNNPYDTPPKERPPPSGQTPYDTPPKTRPGQG